MKSDEALQPILGRLWGRFQAGDAQALDDAYRLIPQNAASKPLWLLLAEMESRLGHADALMDALLKAVQCDRSDVALALQACVLQFRSNDVAGAEMTLDAALAQHPVNVDLLFHRGYLHEHAGNDVAAEAAYRSALAVQPAHADCLANLGVLLSRNGRHREARGPLESAFPSRQQPAIVDALIASCSATNALDAAMHYAELATRSAPASASAWLTAGGVARGLKDLPRAEGYLRRALLLSPDEAAELTTRIIAELAAVLADGADHAGSRMLFKRALASTPANLGLRWQAAMSLPSPSMSMDEAAQAHADFDADLGQLEALTAQSDPAAIRNAYESVRNHVPFALAYLPFDTAPHMRRYGRLLGRWMAALAPRLAAPVAWRALDHRGPIRVGFVSAHVRSHTILRYFRRWLTDRDRRRFHTEVWHLGDVEDDETRAIAAAVDHYHFSPGDPLQVAESIRGSRLDVLVFLDIGMDSGTSLLASLRSAPLQCATYGHPVTSGLESIDVFISGESLERNDAARHYSERLMLLPGLATCPVMPPQPNLAFAAPRKDGRPQLVCAQMPFKLQPDFDRMAAAVIAETDAELFVFSGYATSAVLQQRVLNRLAGTLRERGLDPSRHLRLLPNCAHADYLGILANTDLVLDTPGFTGGATSLDAFHVGTPVATVDGITLRARQTAAMASLIGVTDAVGANTEDCVSRAVQLLRNGDLRDDVRRRTMAAAPRLFTDDAALPALDDLLQALVEERSQNPID